MTRANATPVGMAFREARTRGRVCTTGGIRLIGPRTRLYTIVGKDHLATKAQAMHEVANVNYGWDQCHLQPIEVDSIEAVLEDLLHCDLAAITVTLPYKRNAHAWIKQGGGVFATRSAEVVGAINTILHDHGTLLGWNMDVDGLSSACAKYNVQFAGRNVLIVGAGGMGRAATEVSSVAGANSIFLHDILPDTVQQLISDFQEHSGLRVVLPTPDISKVATDVDIIINCTPEGMPSWVDSLRASHSPIPRMRLTPRMTIVDAVTSETPLLKDARKAGCRAIISGMDIAIYGAIAQLEILRSHTLDSYERQEIERLIRCVVWSIP